MVNIWAVEFQMNVLQFLKWNAHPQTILIYCHVPARWGLRQTTLAPGSDKTRAQGSFGPLTDGRKLCHGSYITISKLQHNLYFWCILCHTFSSFLSHGGIYWFLCITFCLMFVYKKMLYLNHIWKVLWILLDLLQLFASYLLQSPCSQALWPTKMKLSLPGILFENTLHRIPHSYQSLPGFCITWYYIWWHLIETSFLTWGPLTYDLWTWPIYAKIQVCTSVLQPWERDTHTQNAKTITPSVFPRDPPTRHFGRVFCHLDGFGRGNSVKLLCFRLNL